jgi:hypothetical protein
MNKDKPRLQKKSVIAKAKVQDRERQLDEVHKENEKLNNFANQLADYCYRFLPSSVHKRVRKQERSKAESNEISKMNAAMNQWMKGVLKNNMPSL